MQNEQPTQTEINYIINKMQDSFNRINEIGSKNIIDLDKLKEYKSLINIDKIDDLSYSLVKSL